MGGVYLNKFVECSDEKITLTEKLLKLEQTLMYYRQNDFEDILSDEFIEFGSSGEVFDKEIELKSLTEQGYEEIQFNILDFKIIQLADNVAQARYKTENKKSGNKSLRSSIWRKENDTWRLFFHQGTPTT